MPRTPVEKRAGTKLVVRDCLRMYGPSTRGDRQVPHGLLDINRRLYQGGGEAEKFIMRQKRAVTLAADIWRYVCAYTDRIEMVDHDQNLCYVTDTDSASELGEYYVLGNGWRWGVPVDCWDIVNVKGDIVFARTIPPVRIKGGDHAPALSGRERR